MIGKFLLPWVGGFFKDMKAVIFKIEDMIQIKKTE